MLAPADPTVPHYAGDTYSLTFPGGGPFVHLDDANGRRIAELFVLSSIHPLAGRDDTLRVGDWVVTETHDATIFSLEAESSAWRRKTYRFMCQPRGFRYEIEVEGRAALAEVEYFGGYYSGQLRWGSGYFRSGQRFRQGFNPEPNTREINLFGPGGSSTVNLTGNPLPGRDDWFFTPPPFCFAFQVATGWLGLGVEAAAGENRFVEYAYRGQGDSFYLSLGYEGHTVIDGGYRLPAIGFYFAQNEYQALLAHVEALRLAGAVPRAPAPAAPKPDWWREPIFCGWGSQCAAAARDGAPAPGYARQDLYDQFLGALDGRGINPGTVVIDDKWQATYGENEVDRSKWPDLPGWIARQHTAGRKVLLWLKAWDPEGVPHAECITNAARLPIAVDPTNPAFQRRLRSAVRRMLSPAGYDADGFKIDFTARIPSGPNIHLYGHAWGLELMRSYLAIVYEEAKRIKPDALVVAHTPHPYLSDVVDMIRLNDINTRADVHVPTAMRHRAKVANIACPEALIDSDDWPQPNREAWREYQRSKPARQVPALYYATDIDSTLEPLSEEDYCLVRETWARYRANAPTASSRRARDRRPRLAIIHTTPSTVEPLKALAEEVVPGIDVMNLVDDSILPQLKSNGGDVDEVAPRWIQYARAAEEAGAEVILNACSSVGELCRVAQEHVAVPVVRIDEAMAEFAVARASTLGVAATVPTTLHPTVRLLREKAAAVDRQVETQALLVDGAFERLAAGDQEGHDALLVDALVELAAQVELVVLAQASMARVLPRLPQALQPKFLSSPRLGMERVKRVLNGRVDGAPAACDSVDAACAACDLWQNPESVASEAAAAAPGSGHGVQGTDEERATHGV